VVDVGPVQAERLADPQARIGDEIKQEAVLAPATG
jgi:hypothetical protein